MKFTYLAFATICGLLMGCVSEDNRTLPIQKVESATRPYNGTRIPVSVGKFDNRSSFMRGVFTSGEDRLGNQAQTILVSHLQQSQRFSVLNRTLMSEMQQESHLKNEVQSLKAADYIFTGGVTEFGRKEVGDRQLFGILGRGKSQIAYAKVTVNIVNAKTSEVVFSTQGAGEYSLSEREIIGFGGTSSYDSTLNGKVLDLAIRDAINNLVTSMDTGTWQTGGR